MEIPKYGGIKSHIMTETKSFKGVLANKEWGWIIIVGIAYLFAFILGLALVINAVALTVSTTSNGYRHFFPEEKTFAPKTLTYKVATSTKDADGIYRTDFLVSVHVPAGNNEEDISLIREFPLIDVSCEVNTSPLQVSEFRGGLASTTYIYYTSCSSREKILDTGTLFRVDPYTVVK